MKKLLTISALALLMASCQSPHHSVDTPLIWELVFHDSLNADPVAALHVATPRHQSYNWKNHWVLYTDPQDSMAWKNILSKMDAVEKVQAYRQPFYRFEQKNCKQPQHSPEPWKHILLTADLVEDTVKQKEYLEYHRTQFQQWPEVSQGFCNASFQRLLVYKNERQLMLIISIPRDSTLEALNPKTSLNNPRVDDWNKIMGQYQQGIPGTAPGETWVFLNEAKNTNNTAF